MRQQIKGFIGVTDVEWFEKKGTRVKELAARKEEKKCL